MRAVWLLGVSVLAGCTPPEVKNCEGELLTELRSPSTYKRATAQVVEEPRDAPKEIVVYISYDAANIYGTPVREMKVCRYPAKNGKPDFATKEAQETADLERQAAEAENAANYAEAAANAAMH